MNILIVMPCSHHENQIRMRRVKPTDRIHNRSLRLSLKIEIYRQGCRISFGKTSVDSYLRPTAQNRINEEMFIC